MGGYSQSWLGFVYEPNPNQDSESTPAENGSASQATNIHPPPVIARDLYSLTAGFARTENVYKTLRIASYILLNFE
jgi:hypothetical protein